MAANAPIIIVDDDEDEFVMLCDILNELGYTNEQKHFTDGNAAYEYLSTTQDKPLIIFCDVNMPKINGIELRQRIAMSKYLLKKSTPFIFFSTSATEAVINKTYELTVQGFFVKPNNIENYKPLVSSIIQYWMDCKHPNNV